jgi:hypothetical protein
LVGLKVMIGSSKVFVIVRRAAVLPAIAIAAEFAAPKVPCEVSVATLPL